MRRPTEDPDEESEKQQGQVLVEALSKFLKQKLISDQRLNYPETQVISQDNLGQIESLFSKPDKALF